MANNKQEKQRKALDIYVNTDGNASETARSIGVSRVTINEWKKKGLPTSVTGGKTWNEYLALHKDNDLSLIRAKAIDEDFDFHREAMETLQATLKMMRLKLEEGHFEAKPGDLPKIIEMFAKLDTRDTDMKLWMNGIVIKIMKVIAETVDGQQYAVIGTKLLDLNREETEKLKLITDPGLPQIPIRTEYDANVTGSEETPITDAIEAPFTITS